MGVYNTYGDVQLKVSDNLDLTEFEVGDPVDIPDGLYVGYGGFVLIQEGKLASVFESVTSSWGGKVYADDIATLCIRGELG